MNINWKNLDTYFDTFPEGIWNTLFKNCDHPWEPLQKLPLVINQFFQNLDSHSSSVPSAIRKEITGKSEFDGIHVKTSFFLEEPFFDKELEIYIDSGTLLEVGAVIKRKSIILKRCEIRQAAYIRGNVFIGTGCVVGHTTEIKNTIFIQHVEAGHFTYIGDSIVGAYSNLGAGTKISNLQFRTLEQKKKEEFPLIPFLVKRENMNSELVKFGSILGEGTEIGCNSVLSPFVLLGKKSWILPCICIPKGIYKAKSILRSDTIRQNRY